jgi:hypothetical protein
VVVLGFWRAPRPCGACPTQPYKCGQNVKVKVKDNAVLTWKYILQRFYALFINIESLASIFSVKYAVEVFL